MEEVKQLATSLLAEIEAFEAKKTKAGSARIRKLTQRLNNIGPTVRKDLITADKAGY